MLKWTTRINRARERYMETGLIGFTHQDFLDASDWVDCACGRQDKRIPRDHWQAPRDEELRRLGDDFSLWVSADNFDRAESTLAKIDARAAIVLAETLAK